MPSGGGVPSLLAEANVLHVACLGACQVLEAACLATSKSAKALRLLTSWHPEAMVTHKGLKWQRKLLWSLHGDRIAFTHKLSRAMSLF